MALPFDFEENFETGATVFDQGETDSDARFTIRHYSWMPNNNVREVPYQGAYCAVVDLGLTGTANDAYVNHAAFNLANNDETFIRFYFYNQDLSMGTDDRFTIFRILSGGDDTEEGCIEIRENNGRTQIGVAETNTGTGSFVELPLNRWVALELAIVVDDGGDDGSLVLFMDGTNTGAEIASLDQEAITDAHLGVMNQENTTTGIVMFDMFAQDSDRIYPIKRRFSNMRQFTKTSHIALGPSTLGVLHLSGTGGDEEMQIYDSDDAFNTSGGEFNQVVPPLRIGASDDVSRGTEGECIYVEHGAYVVLSGTEPLATVEIIDTQAMSVAGIRNVAVRR